MSDLMAPVRIWLSLARLFRAPDDLTTCVSPKGTTMKPAQQGLPLPARPLAMALDGRRLQETTLAERDAVVTALARPTCCREGEARAGQ